MPVGAGGELRLEPNGGAVRQQFAVVIGDSRQQAIAGNVGKAGRCLAQFAAARLCQRAAEVDDARIVLILRKVEQDRERTEIGMAVRV